MKACTPIRSAFDGRERCAPVQLRGFRNVRVGVDRWGVGCGEGRSASPVNLEVCIERRAIDVGPDDRGVCVISPRRGVGNAGRILVELEANYEDGS